MTFNRTASAVALLIWLSCCSRLPCLAFGLDPGVPGSTPNFPPVTPPPKIEPKIEAPPAPPPVKLPETPKPPSATQVLLQNFGGSRIQTDLTPNFNLYVQNEVRRDSGYIPFRPGTRPDTTTQQELENMEVITGGGKQGSFLPLRIAFLKKPNTASDYKEPLVAQVPANGSSVVSATASPGVVFVFDRAQATVIKTSNGTVYTGAGSAVLVYDNTKSTSVFDLHSRGQEDVVFTAEGRKIRMYPGLQLTLSREDLPFEQVNPPLGIAYRLSKKLKLGGSQLYASEFQIPTAVVAIPPLKKQLASSEGSRNMALRAILKDAVIMSGM